MSTVTTSKHTIFQMIHLHQALSWVPTVFFFDSIWTARKISTVQHRKNIVSWLSVIENSKVHSCNNTFNARLHNDRAVGQYITDWIYLYRWFQITLKTVSKLNVGNCQLVKFHLHMALTLSVRNGECSTNRAEKPGEMLLVFLSVVSLFLKINSM